MRDRGVGVATARAGNVVGGGDWAVDRIVPDVMRSLSQGKTIGLRNPTATRPWQHVLEAINGYLIFGLVDKKPRNTLVFGWADE